jgi:hypothetical protein
MYLVTKVPAQFIYLFIKFEVFIQTLVNEEVNYPPKWSTNKVVII